MKITHTVVLSTVLLTAPLITLADALKLNPGLWETTVEMTNPYTGTQTRTHTECVTENKFDPGSMMGPNDHCKINESKVDGNTLTFKMSCDVEGGEGEMTGKYTSDGNTGTGEMVMKISFGGQTMEMKSTTQAKRLGDC